MQIITRSWVTGGSGEMKSRVCFVVESQANNEKKQYFKKTKKLIENRNYQDSCDHTYI